MYQKEEAYKILDDIGIKIINIDAYGWGKTNVENVGFNKMDSYCGWWNECYNFGMFYTKNKSAMKTIDKIANEFNKHQYWTAKVLYNPFGYACLIDYCEMTKEESHQKALSNLMSGGRMSD